MDDGIGAAVRAARLRRGMSLEVLGGLIGRDKSWLSRVERGLLPLEKRSDITALAAALRLSPTDLTGQPYPIPADLPCGPAARDGVADIRRAVLDEPTGQPVPLAELTRQVEALADLNLDCKVGATAQAAGRLLGDLRASASGPDRPEVLRLLVVACAHAAGAVDTLGHYDLGLHVDALAEATAAELADPMLLALTAVNHSYGLADVGVGAYRAAARVASEAADALAPVGGRQAAAAAGHAQLAASWALAVLGNSGEVADRLAEAERLAARVDGPTVFARHMDFSGANARLHRLSTLVELGEPDAAVANAGAVPVGELHIRRQTSYWIALGRAYAALRRDADAVAAFRRAEALSPMKALMHPLAREAVAGMVGRAQRAAVGRELRGLAYRFQVPH